MSNMRQQIREEMEHIPRGTKLSPQNMLRMTYQALRTSSLAGGRTGGPGRGQVLQQAMDTVRKTTPDAQLRFDQAYFGL